MESFFATFASGSLFDRTLATYAGDPVSECFALEFYPRSILGRLPEAPIIAECAPLDGGRRRNVIYIDGLGPPLALSPGDIILADPEGRIEVLFRRRALDNSLFITHMCNSRCIFCSQPPSGANDLAARFATNSSLIDLLPRDLTNIGITGGEPTMLGMSLADLIRSIIRRAPQAQVEVLSNGRAFAWPEFADRFSERLGAGVVLEVPLHGDNYLTHDGISRSPGSFIQTLTGLHNLARCGVRVRIRVAVNLQNISRLLQIADFISKNLPFVECVSFMELEIVGLGLTNFARVWCPNPGRSSSLQQAVALLADSNIVAFLYNFQYCNTDRSIWPWLVPSISKWKRCFLNACESCAMRSHCGGFFGTSPMAVHECSPIPRDVALEYTGRSAAESD